MEREDFELLLKREINYAQNFLKDRSQENPLSNHAIWVKFWIIVIRGAKKLMLTPNMKAYIQRQWQKYEVSNNSSTLTLRSYLWDHSSPGSTHGMIISSIHIVFSDFLLIITFLFHRANEDIALYGGLKK